MNDIISISTRKEYFNKRMSLTSSMVLFFGYHADEDNQAWFEILVNMQKKFQQSLEILIFSNQSEKSLVEEFLDEGNDDLNSIDYPAGILCHPHITEPQILKDFDPATLYSVIEGYHNFYIKEFNIEKNKMFTRIENILSSFPIVTFIKGTPQDPFCKYSKSFIEILKKLEIKYKSFDIFQDEKIRCYLRLYSGWKTYPQLYIHGKIIGGVDRLKELVESGEFMKMVPPECTKEGTIEKIKTILHENQIVVFSKGDISTVKCTSSKAVLDILISNKIKFELVDVLKDSMVRDLVKSIFNQPYYPQIYLNGVFLGGSVVLKDLEMNKKIFEVLYLSSHLFYIENKEKLNEIVNENNQNDKGFLITLDQKVKLDETFYQANPTCKDCCVICVDDYPILRHFLNEEIGYEKFSFCDQLKNVLFYHEDTIRSLPLH